MTEILTESFCERCGTRYTFESSAPRRSRLGRMRTFSKGVRNFVMSDEASFSEAMAEARSEQELSATTRQLDAFHQTFNFCLTCRQYTCATCWNASEGRCLTCAPIPGMEDAAAAPAVAGAPSVDGNGHSHVGVDDTWPEADLARIAEVLGEPASPFEPGSEDQARFELPLDGPLADSGTHETTGVEGPVGGEVAASPAGDLSTLPPGSAGEGIAGLPAPLADLTASPEPIASPTSDVDATEWSAAAAAAAAEPVDSHLIGVEPGQSLEDAVAAYETRLAAEEEAEQAVVGQAGAPAAAGSVTGAVPEADIGQAAGFPQEAEASREAEVPAPQPAAARPDVADAAAMAEAAGTEPDRVELPPAAAPAEAAPAAATPPTAAPDDVIEQPTWPVRPLVQPATTDRVPAAEGVPPAPAPAPWLRVAPDDGGAAPSPQWPAAPAWRASADREYPTTLAGRPLLPRDDASALWAASAREVLGPAPASGPVAPATPSPQPCVQCGLSLSANARFCRRCGTRQG
jgi:ribosomal protein L40E